MLYALSLLALVPLVASQDCANQAEQGTLACGCYETPCLDIASGYGSDLTITTNLGDITGKSDGTINRFIGVPIAASTAGANRWKPPQQATSWSSAISTTKERVCVQGAADSQNNALSGSEDCLSVDIFMPVGASSLPMNVWVHGGGFTSQNPWFQFLSNGLPYQRKSFTYLPNNGHSVSFLAHYRLGALGWMSHPGFNAGGDAFSLYGTTYATVSNSGNYGMMDTIAAARFAQVNAVAFGGDSSKISFFGESAGAAHVCMLAASPLTSFIAGFIAQSPFISFSKATFSIAARQTMGTLFTNRTGCGPVAIVSAGTEATTEAACLRSASLLDIVPDVGFYGPGQSYEVTVAFDAVFGPGASYLFRYNSIHVWPVVDGVVLDLDPLSAYATYNGNAGMIVGHNTDEYTTFCWSPPFAINPALSAFGINPSYICSGPDVWNQGWILALVGTTGSEDFATIYGLCMAEYNDISTPGTKMNHVANGLYYSDFLDQNEKTNQMGTDAWFAAGNYVALNALVSNPSRTAGVYHYVFGSETDTQFDKMGACHGCELTYVLGFYLDSMSFLGSMVASFGLGTGTFAMSEEYVQLGNTMNSYWASFFATQNPNAAGSGLPTWTQWGGASDEQTMFFSDTMAAPHAAMNPCVSVASCRTEPTKSWRHAAKTFWYSSASTEATLPPTCDTPSVASLTHSVDSLLGSCPTFQCASWCNVYTTGMSACSSCTLNSVSSSGAYCASWCNVYTCSFNMCTGCSLCDNVLTDAHCYSWCNAFTCSLSGCSACSTCAEITAGTYYASWCNAYTCFLPGGICSGYPGC